MSHAKHATGLLVTALASACDGCAPQAQDCAIVSPGALPDATGDAVFDVEAVADGLTVPWGIAFLPDGDLLVTERDGNLMLIDVDGGAVVDILVLTLPVSTDGEAGLLGIALDPQFDGAANARFFLYRTLPDGAENVVERYLLAADRASAALDVVVVSGIPAGPRHDGGRLRIGPDGHLWITTGEVGEPSLSRDLSSLAGKVLRVTLDGEPVDGNVVVDGAPSRIAVSGVRNSQGIAFVDDDIAQLVVTDHGPSGEFLRSGHDELVLAQIGDDLGWPDADACDVVEGVRSPTLVFEDALPPGGTALFEGRVFVGALGARMLVEVDVTDAGGAADSAVVHLRGELGRIRDVIAGPDGALWLTTSNCDGRGDCPDSGDAVVRLTR